MSDDVTLGRLLGRREAFNIIAARCSAAEAAHLRQLREQKNYLDCKTWDEFCERHLHTSKDSANRVIRYLEEFGPSYFEVAQLTRISPATYRAIAPAIQDQALHHNGEAIALIPENAEKVTAAVAALRKKEAPPKPAMDPLRKLNQQCDELVEAIEGVAQDRNYRNWVIETISSVTYRLRRISAQV